MENRRRLELLTFTCEENALPAEPTLNVHLIVRLLVNKKALNHVQTIQNKSAHKKERLTATYIDIITKAV